MKKLILLFLFIVLSTSCSQEVPEPLSNDTVSAALKNLYTDFGGASKVNNQRIIGQHYHPGDDNWSIVSCIDFNLKDGRKVDDCNDSFVALQLNSGKWILQGKVNGQYRWIEVPVTPNG